MGINTGTIKMFFHFLFNEYTKLYFVGSGFITGTRLIYSFTVAAQSIPEGLLAISIFVFHTAAQTLIPVTQLTFSSWDAITSTLGTAAFWVLVNIIAGGIILSKRWRDAMLEAVS